MLSERRYVTQELFPNIIGDLTGEHEMENGDTLRVRVLPECGYMEIEVVAEDGFIAGSSYLNPARVKDSTIVVKPDSCREGMRQTYFVGLAY